MELIQKLRTLFISDLQEYSPLLEEDLKNLLVGASLPYSDGKALEDIVAFCFEYDVDDLSVSFWALGENAEVITDLCTLPSQLIENRFLSDTFTEQEESLEDRLYETDLEENEIEDLLLEYKREREAIFTNWFVARWKNATEELGMTIDAFFSKYNAYYKTELNSLELVSLEEIQEKYQNNANKNSY